MVSPPLLVRPVPVASAVSVESDGVAEVVSVEKGQWNGVEDEVSHGIETGPGPW